MVFFFLVPLPAFVCEYNKISHFLLSYKILILFRESSEWLVTCSYLSFCILCESKFRHLVTKDIKFNIVHVDRSVWYLSFGLIYRHVLDILVIINSFPKQALVFTCLQYKSCENTEGKGEIARNEQFLLFPQCFLPIWMDFLSFSSDLKLSSAYSFNLEESKICRLGKGWCRSSLGFSKQLRVYQRFSLRTKCKRNRTKCLTYA